MITGLQIRAARGALRWSAAKLADMSGVSVPTIQRLEQTDLVPPSRASSLVAIQQALEAAGIEFIGAPTDRPGIRVGPPTAPAAASD
jgi:transcriptional regulator with XRE-family HTH domain